MLYKEKNQPFSEELFKNPPAIYRGTPFWAWNSALRSDVLGEQIDTFEKMGFGGFHMHVRQGLETPYLSDEFLNAVRFCTKEAKSRAMYAWLYDEDRWPSGCAGGEVTKTVAYRQKKLCMTLTPRENARNTAAEVTETGDPLFLGAFEIICGSDGALVSYRRLKDGETSENCRYFYCLTNPGREPRFNGQSYVDTLSKPAMARFIELTYETYKKALGDDFGTACPAIFTDEPQAAWRAYLKSGNDSSDGILPWTWDFSDTYQAEFGENILERLPELFLTDRDGRGNDLRYRYKKHLCDRFCEAFTDQIGGWCRDNGIMLTGHEIGEDSLQENTDQIGDVMMCYRGMGLPGMDLLCNDRAFVTAVQCRSAVRQFGREGMLSELYGVTGWDFDFRGYKFQGDWQACLGVTVRVPHLAWQTMKGEGKRDYPAPISYQSPWWQDYSYIEDHFARVHLALTRGNPSVRVAVVRPVETDWMYAAQENMTSDIRRELNEHYQTLAEWLLCGSVDFDYLSEGLLPDLCPKGTNPLQVGKMAYDLILVSDCETLRTHTLQILKEYAEAGGKLLFFGKLPKYENAIPSETAEQIVKYGSVLPFSRSDVLRAVDPYREVTVCNADGRLTENLLTTLRREEKTSWLFLAHAGMPVIPSLSQEQKIEIRLKGGYLPTVLNTQDGTSSSPDYETDGRETRIRVSVYDYQSLLFRLDHTPEPSSYRAEKPKENMKEIPLALHSLTLSDPNVLLLDIAEWSLDGGEYQPADEMMRVDEKIRMTLGMPSRRSKVIQPWAIAKAPEDHTAALRFTFTCEDAVHGAELAAENLLKSEIVLNGKKVSVKDAGYYADKEIRKTLLPALRKGENTLEISFPFGQRVDIENAFLLGDFGVSYAGSRAVITAKPDRPVFGDLTRQGYFFYGGNVDYQTEFSLDKPADVILSANEYRGAAVRLILDGQDRGILCYPPYRVRMKNLPAGNHTLTLRLLGNRYNTFSALHNLEDNKPRVYMGPDYWRSRGDAFSYEYRVRPFGILKTPQISVIENKK